MGFQLRESSCWYKTSNIVNRLNQLCKGNETYCISLWNSWRKCGSDNNSWKVMVKLNFEEIIAPKEEQMEWTASCIQSSGPEKRSGSIHGLYNAVKEVVLFKECPESQKKKNPKVLYEHLVETKPTDFFPSPENWTAGRRETPLVWSASNLELYHFTS